MEITYVNHKEITCYQYCPIRAKSNVKGVIEFAVIKTSVFEPLYTNHAGRGAAYK
jgi:hypothetical protein